jgi:hypothetical protein
LELIKDYDLRINGHPGKANVVADAWSRRYAVSQLAAENMLYELCEEFDKLKFEDCSQYGSKRDGGRFYSTPRNSERSIGRRKDPGDKASYQLREATRIYGR